MIHIGSRNCIVVNAGAFIVLGLSAFSFAQDAGATQSETTSLAGSAEKAVQPPAGTSLQTAKPAAPATTDQIGPQKPMPQMPSAPQPTVVLKPGEIPAIEFDTPEYDFGRAKAGGEITHDFWFSNTGTGPLEILAVKPSCGCTTAGEYSRIVPPGETGKIPIKVHTAAFSGPLSKTVMIDTNVPGSMTTTLKISGTTWMPVDATPNAANFGRITPDEAAKGGLVQRVTINNNVNDQMKISDIKSTNPSFRAEVHELEPGKKAELVISLVPPLSAGSVYSQFSMSTGIPDTPTLQVTASVYVAPDVEVTPAVINMVSSQKGAKQYISVRVNSTDNVKISDLTASNACMTPTLEEVTPGKYFRIAIDIPTTCELSPAGEKISFKTDHPKNPQMDVMVYERVIPTVTPMRPDSSAAASAAPSTVSFIPAKPEEVKTPNTGADSKAAPATPEKGG